MSAYCVLCDRPFKAQIHLDQHIQDSSAHKKAMAKSAHGQPANAIVSGSVTPQVIEPSVKTDGNSRWSVISELEYKAVLNALSVRCHLPEELEENGFIQRPYDPQDYINSRKCKRCHSQETKVYNRECTFHPSKRDKWNRAKPYKCCETQGKGCMTLPTHDFQLSLLATQHKDFLPTPAASTKEPKFRAVTIDCEMAGISDGSGEAIFLCVIDYVTGAILLNRFVCPTEKITQMRSAVHGISKSTLNAAVSKGQALSGWEGARAELWKYIDDNTILVGQALQHDLNALRVIHHRVVDSGILSGNAVGIPRVQCGLKTLCRELLNFEIRNNKRGVHDCLEDVLATREVVLFCTRNEEIFQNWAEAKKIEMIRLEEQREIERQKWKDEQARENGVRAGAELEILAVPMGI